MIAENELQKHLQWFSQWPTAFANSSYEVRNIGEHAFSISPKFPSNLMDGSDREFDLVVLALVHGVEVGGISVVNQVLEMLKSETVKLNASVAFVLGNVPAAEAGKRYLERDLNRSFASISRSKSEERRAEFIESILKRGRYLLDMHQTREFSPTPFFIFPFTPEGFRFSTYIAPEIPLVTRWDGEFSKEGMCSDEFMNANGGVGITIELGQNGFGGAGIGIGVTALLNAMRFVSGSNLPKRGVSHQPIVYTWEQVLPYPPEGEVQLRADLCNFVQLKIGDMIATCNGKTITSPCNGKTLFPQHYRDRSLPRPSELVRLLRQLSDGEMRDRKLRVD
jgi:succinylglutamate desuccinylase